MVDPTIELYKKMSGFVFSMLLSGSLYIGQAINCGKITKLTEFSISNKYSQVNFF